MTMINFHFCQNVIDSIFVQLFSNSLAKSTFILIYFSFLQPGRPTLKDSLDYSLISLFLCSGLIAAIGLKLVLYALCPLLISRYILSLSLTPNFSTILWTFHPFDLYFFQSATESCQSCHKRVFQDIIQSCTQHKPIPLYASHTKDHRES